MHDDRRTSGGDAPTTPRRPASPRSTPILLPKFGSRIEAFEPPTAQTRHNRPGPAPTTYPALVASPTPRRLALTSDQGSVPGGLGDSRSGPTRCTEVSGGRSARWRTDGPASRAPTDSAWVAAVRRCRQHCQPRACKRVGGRLAWDQSARGRKDRPWVTLWVGI